MGVSVKLDVYKTDGSTTGEQIQLSPEIFEIEPNEHAIWLAITASQANARQGTASTKNKGEVSGGGKKPWRQKGRGTARSGSNRSPVWRGGGRVFGPEPRGYHKQVPKKVNKLARKSILSLKAKEDQIKLIEDFAFDAPKTKQMAEILKNLQINEKKTMVLISDVNQSIRLSAENLPKCSVKVADNFSAYDALNAEVLLIQKSGLTKINEVLTK